jgi:hypothetical protein
MRKLGKVSAKRQNFRMISIISFKNRCEPFGIPDVVYGPGRTIYAHIKNDDLTSFRRFTLSNFHKSNVRVVFRPKISAKRSCSFIRQGLEAYDRRCKLNPIIAHQVPARGATDEAKIVPELFGLRSTRGPSSEIEMTSGSGALSEGYSMVTMNCPCFFLTSFL